MVRFASASDTAALARLATALGYPCDDGVIRERLARVEGFGAVLVAEVEGAVVGWLHIARLPQLTTDDDARILALVVDEAHRGRGIGASILAAAEAWAAAQGCAQVTVASRLERGRAHAFYERAGYTGHKTQKAFRKAL